MFPTVILSILALVTYAGVAFALTRRVSTLQWERGIPRPSPCRIDHEALPRFSPMRWHEAGEGVRAAAVPQPCPLAPRREIDFDDKVVLSLGQKRFRWD